MVAPALRRRGQYDGGTLKESGREACHPSTMAKINHVGGTMIGIIGVILAILGLLGVLGLISVGHTSAIVMLVIGLVLVVADPSVRSRF